MSCRGERCTSQVHGSYRWRTRQSVGDKVIQIRFASAPMLKEYFWRLRSVDIVVATRCGHANKSGGHPASRTIALVRTSIDRPFQNTSSCSPLEMTGVQSPCALGLGASCNIAVYVAPR
ncbi:hypothetical protein BAUCODRAFT_263831 [Baudoinia panamericana UAMH 10762]|uniref:Uncharacterized protein n=1 Tax=Baudoinia panamericana (strain UAMH 10762) TaxID=717646 RepID=M2M8V9_BAUPA|nr:uncharacterized protein BAUCODRAFT_263831 [Baudoinia panamericana UAMH 10762]EMC92841.1 hypothetical protein BAUCODRAFT_263831 [Baudoinia panamericana UAMH 10762]